MAIVGKNEGAFMVNLHPVKLLLLVAALSSEAAFAQAVPWVWDEHATAAPPIFSQAAGPQIEGRLTHEPLLQLGPFGEGMPDALRRCPDEDLLLEGAAAGD